ncbi:B12-binding domain-containing radical SAM protein [Streptomyces sp. NPDC001279]|uniref:B12-binding domain-containing radical SAM protein n=1 Tax=Streptomyces sp. NPDC001279 TaxID=3364556 RepID=UPI0036C5C6D8
MHAVLLFPPAADPRSPHLALPSLTSRLRRNGVEVTQRDLDVEAVDALLRPAALERAAGVCRDRRSRRVPADERDRLDRVLAMAERTLELAPGAADTLRDPVAFYHPLALAEAREALSHGLRMVGAAHGVDWDIAPVTYAVDAIDPARLPDLDRATADPAVNVFEDHWSHGILADLEAARPDLVGISILNHQQVIPGLTLARRCKSAGHTVVIGGTVYAKFASALLRRPRFFTLFCDALVPYEGEAALLGVLERLADGRDLAGVPNTVALDASGAPVAGRVVAEDVAALPTPDFEGLPLDRYLTPVPVLPILTGKGCYFNKCRFCDIPHINRVAPRPYRTRPPAVVAEDIARLTESHGCRHYEITDEALSPRFLLRLGEALAERDLDVSLVGYARLEPGFDAATCERLAAMGVRKLFFGLESGSQRMLDHMDKGVRLPVASQVLRAVHEAGICLHLFSMVGFPQETEQDAQRTLSFLLDHADVLADPRHSFDVHGFSLDLRTDYFEQADRFGIEMDAEELAGADFPLSVRSWTSAGGLSTQRAQQLVADFQAVLRARFPVHRQFPAHLWPSFEEYAMLYAERYGTDRFPWQLCLPPPGDPLLFRLEWPRSTRFRPTGEGFVAESFTGRVRTPRQLLQLLARPAEPCRVDDLLGALASQVAPGGDRDTHDRAVIAKELRGMIDEMLAAGVLWLVPAAGTRIGAAA